MVWGAQFVVGNAPAPYTPTNSTTTLYASGQTGTPGTLVQTGLNQSYSYDSFGNIQQNGSFQTSYTPNNQMFGYEYDAAGNLLSDGMNIMTWDAESRMATAGGATYIYDAEGNRVEKQGSSVVDTVYFGGQPIARYSNGQWTDLIYGPTGLLTEVPGLQNGQPVYRVTDNLGTNVGGLLANGTFVDPIDHTPFGQVFTGNTSDPYFFTGKERDTESGLDYFGARYYACNMGRWMSPDWAAKAMPVPYAKLDNPQSLNLYGYVGNNPLSRTDQDGHCFWCQDTINSAKRIVADVQNIVKSGSLMVEAGTGYKGEAKVGGIVHVHGGFSAHVEFKTGAPTVAKLEVDAGARVGTEKTGVGPSIEAGVKMPLEKDDMGNGPTPSLYVESPNVSVGNETRDVSSGDKDISFGGSAYDLFGGGAHVSISKDSVSTLGHDLVDALHQIAPITDPANH